MKAIGKDGIMQMWGSLGAVQDVASLYAEEPYSCLSGCESQLKDQPRLLLGTCISV